jgi:hypothetical protein
MTNAKIFQVEIVDDVTERVKQALTKDFARI